MYARNLIYMSMAFIVAAIATGITGLIGVFLKVDGHYLLSDDTAKDVQFKSITVTMFFAAIAMFLMASYVRMKERNSRGSLWLKGLCASAFAFTGIRTIFEIAVSEHITRVELAFHAVALIVIIFHKKSKPDAAI